MKRKASYNHPVYTLVQLKSPATDQHHMVPFQRIQCTGKLHHHLAGIWRWLKPKLKSFVLGRNWQNCRCIEQTTTGKQGIKQSSYVHNHRNPYVPQLICIAQGNLSLDPVAKQISFSVAGGKNPSQSHLYQARIRRSNAIWREEGKRKTSRKENTNGFFPTVPSSETLLTHFLHYWVLDLASSVSPLLNECCIQPAI